MTDTTSPARRSHADAAIRLGILTAPLAGALKLVGNLGTFNSVGYGIPQTSEAAIAAGPGFLIGELVGSTLPTVLTPFWVCALFTYLRPIVRARRTLAAAVTCWVTGAGFALAALGVVNYAIPALAHAYQGGDTGAMDVVDSLFTWPRVAMFFPAVLVPLGTIVFAIAVWRSGALPRTAAMLFATSSVLISAPGPLHTLHLAGGVLTLVSGLWIAQVIWSQPAHRAGSPPAQSNTPAHR